MRPAPTQGQWRGRRGAGPSSGRGAGAAAPRAPAPRLSHASSPRPMPWPRNPRLRSVSGPRGSPSTRRSTIILESGVAPDPVSPAAPHLAAGAVSAAHFYLRSDFDAKNRARPPRSAPPWEAGRGGGACHMSLGVCVCVPVCVLGTGAPVLCAPSSPGCPGLDSTQGTWPAVTAPGAPGCGQPLGQGPGCRSPCRCKGGGPPLCLRGPHPVPPPPGPGHALLLGALGGGFLGCGSAPLC